MRKIGCIWPKWVECPQLGFIWPSKLYFAKCIAFSLNLLDKTVPVWQNWFYSRKSVVYGHICFYLVKMVVFSQKWFHLTKLVVFGQN